MADKTGLPPQLDEPLRLLGRALEPLCQRNEFVVVCGGIASALYTRVWIQAAPIITTTREVDLAIPRSGSSGVVTALVEGAGLHRYDVPGLDPGHAAKSLFQDADPTAPAPVYLELLATSDSEVGKILGATVTCVPDLKLLLHEPIKLGADQVPELQITGQLEFHLPNPAMFILQKTRARETRLRDKRQKDMAAIYLAARASESAWDDAKVCFDSLVGQGPPSSGKAKNGWKTLRTLFETPESEGAREASDFLEQVAGARAPTASDVNRVVMRFHAHLAQAGW